MITVSEPIISRINDNLFSVSITITYTDDKTQEIIATKGINANVGKDDNVIVALQSLIDKAVEELKKENDDLVQFKAKFTGFKTTINSAISAKEIK